MCGIVGGVTRSSHIVPFLIQGLAALEYRGYDSAGIAVKNGLSVTRLRTTGRVSELNRRAAPLLETELHCGIGHTRWATHGAPSERNAHPHSSKGHGCQITLVHNGIVENHEPLRASLQSRGYVFTSDTDTEVVAHLIHWHNRKLGSVRQAIRAACQELKGLFALAVLDGQDEDTLYAIRQGAPLLLGIADDGNYLASDVSALLSKTRVVVTLNDGDLAILRNDTWQVEGADGTSGARATTRSALDETDVALNDHAHYMHKEIFEQPAAIAKTIALASLPNALEGSLFGPEGIRALATAKEVLVLACGTSYHAGLIGRHWIETIAKIPCTVEIASEFRYREPVLRPNTLVVVISQSGETADTRSALEYAQRAGAKNCMAICNVPESAITKMVNLVLLTRAGPEIGVASTKAFTTQLVALHLLSLSLARANGTLDVADTTQRLGVLATVPDIVAEVIIKTQPQLREWAKILAKRTSAMFLGRGAFHAVAMEGSLKLKEITYIHAEAYAAGELKHGPLALIDASMPVIVSLPNNELLDKVKANIEEVLARKGEVFVVADKGCNVRTSAGTHVLELPQRITSELGPLVHAVVYQLLAYFTAIERGTDIDKPRNLAKAVSCE